MIKQSPSSFKWFFNNSWESADSQELLKNHLKELGDCLIIHLQDFDYDQRLQGKLYNIAEKLKDNPSMYEFSSEENDLLCMFMGWNIEMTVSDFEEEKLQEEMFSEVNELIHFREHFLL